jgi:TonB family protein
MNKWFNIALGISIGIHAAFVGIAAFNSFSLNRDKPRLKKEETQIEFTQILPQEQEKKTSISRNLIVKEPPPYMDIKEQLTSLKKTAESEFREIEIENTTQEKRRVVFNKPEESLDSMPAYVSYYEKIRNQIRQTAYSNYKSDIDGKIQINFTVNKNGLLDSIAINQAQSTDSAYLKDLALNSIRNSAPFPEFPARLQSFENLNFNLSMHFKRN